MALPTRTVALYERILEAVPGGVVYVAHNGNLLLANEPAQKFLGLRLDEKAQRYVSDFDGETYNDDGSICSVEDYPVSRCLGTGEPQPAQVVGVRQPNGEVRWAVFTALPFDPGDGSPSGAVVSFVDITERKRAEQHVRLLQAELAQRERLATVGTLAAAVAHEVNNPLAFIFLGLESAHDALQRHVGTVHQEIATPMRQVEEGAIRVRDIVSDLMTFARVRDQATEEIDVVESVRTALRMAAPELRYRATIVEDLVDVPPVLAVAGRLSQVFLNLLLNAGRSFETASPENRVKVTVCKDDDRVVVEVSDNGRGVDPDVVPRIFDPFFTTRDDGMGLGLPISRSLVEEMNGTLTLDSSHSPGALFRLSLPVAEESEPTVAVSQMATPGQRVRLLLVDDEEIILELARRALPPEYDVTVAGSVADAIEQLENGEAFDVIVCDTMMLDGAGVEVYRWVETHAPEKQERFLFITGGTFTDDVSDFLAEREPPILRKPFSRAEFTSEVAALLGRD